MQELPQHQHSVAAIKAAALLCLLLLFFQAAALLCSPQYAYAYSESASIYLCDENGDMGQQLESGSTVKAEDLERGVWLEVDYDGDDDDPLDNVANPGWSYTLIMGTDMDYDNTKANGEPTCSDLMSDHERLQLGEDYGKPIKGTKHLTHLYSVDSISLDVGATIGICAVRSSSEGSSTAKVLESFSFTLGEADDDDSKDDDDGKKESDSDGTGGADSGSSSGGQSGGSTSGSDAKSSGGSKSAGSSGSSLAPGGSNIGTYTGTPTENAGRIRWTSFETIDDQRPDKDGGSDALPTAVQEVPDANGETLSDLGRVYSVYNNAVAYDDAAELAGADAAQASAQIDIGQLFVRAILPFAIALLVMVAWGGLRYRREHDPKSPSRLRMAPAREGKHSVVR